MADRINGFKVNSAGGLDTNRDVLSQADNAPGSAIQLINYEPSIAGGYRRLSGYYNSYGTVTGTGDVLGVAIADNINNGIFACRKPSAGTDYFYRWVTGSSSWTAVTTPGTITMVGVKKVRFNRYNMGSPKIVLTDGINPAATYDGTTYTQITDSNAPNSPKYSAVYKNHLFLAGDTTDPYNLYFSAPLTETNFNPANGAGVINIGFEVVQIKQFRDVLYIFGKNAIKALAGTNIADFIVTEITTNLGCLVPDSVIELGGNLLFLGPDGFRPIAGTNKIGDVELETVSKKIQSVASGLIVDLYSGSIDPESVSSVVLRKKSQFRLLSSSSSIFGILGGLRQGAEGTINYEYGLIYGMQVTCAASGYINSEEFIIHGDSTGKIFRQETGTSFGGADILSVYQTPYYYFEDPTVRKNFYNVSTFLKSEGTANIVFSVTYDFEDSYNVYNPANFTISTTGTAAYYNEAVYNSTAIYDGNPSPVVKTAFTGSGFSIAFKYVTNDQNASHTVQGLVLNYSLNDRR